MRTENLESSFFQVSGPGRTHEKRDVPACLGKAALAGCVCKVATIVEETGRIVQLTKLQDLAYGEMNGEMSARITQLDAVMQNAGFDARLSASIEREMWEKWILLATIGGINCLMRGNIGQVAREPGGVEFSRNFLAECVATTTACGHPPSPEFLTATEALVTAKESTQTSSMYRDLQIGKVVEADQIIGDLLLRAQRLQVPAPLLSAAYTSLSIYQAGIAGAS